MNRTDTPRHVLLVNPDLFTRSILASYLRAKGFQVKQATHEEEAVLVSATRKSWFAVVAAGAGGPGLAHRLTARLGEQGRQVLRSIWLDTPVEPQALLLALDPRAA